MANEQNQKLNLTIQAYHDFSQTEAGKLILDDLKKKFSVSAFFINKNAPIDPYRTHVDIGKMQVFGYIEQQIERELLPED